MDVLCTDKTGTLTQGRIALERHTDAWGEPAGPVLELAWLNSRHQTGLKNLLDQAVLEGGAATFGTLDGWAKVDEVPFDFARRRMSVVVAAPGGGRLLVCKGALEEMLAVCSHVERGDERLPLDDALRGRIQQVATELNQQGLRVIAVASRVFDATQQQASYGVADEAGLTMAGHVAFLDPAKASAAPALQALLRHGVAVKVLTGDNEHVTRKVCGEVGLPAGRIVLGAEVEQAIFDLTTFALMWFVFGADTPAEQTLFQSGWFVVGLLTQTLIVHMIRTRRLPFVQSRAATPLLVMTAVIVALGVWLPMGPLAHYFKLQALPPLYFAVLPVMLLAYMALTQAVKGWYARRYGWQ